MQLRMHLQAAAFPVESPLSASASAMSLTHCSVKQTSLECSPSLLGIDDSLSPASLDSSVVIGERDREMDAKYTTAASASASPINSTSVQCRIEVDPHHLHFFYQFIDMNATLQTGLSTCLLFKKFVILLLAMSTY